MRKDEFNQHFFTKLGEMRLLPGGKIATDWLIANADFRADKKVLEVACHTGITAVRIAKEFACQVVAIETDEQLLTKTRQLVHENALENLIQVQNAEPFHLPFDDNSFDVVINEAMLTLLPQEAKEQAIREYLRVLKPNGFLLTHDLMLQSESDNTENLIALLQETVHPNTSPLNKADWKNLFQQCGFRNVDVYSGEMTLLSPKGLLRDEGVFKSLKILRNGIKSENRDTFKTLLKTFNDPANRLGFIAVCSQK